MEQPLQRAHVQGCGVESVVDEVRNCPLSSNQKRLAGQVVHIRALSKKLLFFDVTIATGCEDPAYAAGETFELVLRTADGHTTESIASFTKLLHLGDQVLFIAYPEPLPGRSALLHLCRIAITLPWKSFSKASFVPHHQQASFVAKPLEHTLANVCKFYLNTSRCTTGDACRLWHPAPEDLKRLRAEWIESREQRRKLQWARVGDAQDPHAKEDKLRRGKVFSEWLVNKFSLALLSSGEGVCDVAGGRGDLSFELFNVRHIRTTLIDPREPKLRPAQRRTVRQPRLKMQANNNHTDDHPPLNLEVLESDSMDSTTCNTTSSSNNDNSNNGNLTINSNPSSDVPTSIDREAHCLCPHIRAKFGNDLVATRRAFFDRVSVFVGLHPDQATEPIVDVALSLQKPFAVVPCCVFPTENPQRKLADGSPVVSYEDFITYLRAKHPEIQVEFLPLCGANQVVYYRGPSSSVKT